MYTKEEKKLLREEFWSQFKKYSAERRRGASKSGKWIMDQTGIKQLSLKFHIDENSAWVGFEINSSNLDKRIDLFDKFEKLKKILSGAIPENLHWELEEHISATKSVSRIYAQKPNVSIYKENCWKEVFLFFYKVMEPAEDVFLEYFDFLKYS